MSNIKKNMFYKLFIFNLLMFISGGVSAGDIFKCTDDKSEVYYNDKPCPITDLERKIKSVKDPIGGYIPPVYVPKGELSKNTKSIVTNNNGNQNSEDNNDKASNSSVANSSSNSTSSSRAEGGERSDKSLNQAGSSNTDASGKSGHTNANKIVVDNVR